MESEERLCLRGARHFGLYTWIYARYRTRDYVEISFARRTVGSDYEGCGGDRSARGPEGAHCEVNCVGEANADQSWIRSHSAGSASGTHRAPAEAETLSGPRTYRDLLDWRLDGADRRSNGSQRDAQAPDAGRDRSQCRDLQGTGVPDSRSGEDGGAQQLRMARQVELLRHGETYGAVHCISDAGAGGIS